jgi:hypothetical protein
MVNFRTDEEFLAEFDKIAKKHNRSRTGELKELMLNDIRSEKPEYQPPENY